MHHWIEARRPAGCPGIRIVRKKDRLADAVVESEMFFRVSSHLSLIGAALDVTRLHQTDLDTLSKMCLELLVESVQLLDFVGCADENRVISFFFPIWLPLV